MFLKNCWYVAGWDHELIDGKLLSRVLLNEHVLLYRGESGKVVAMNDRCPHRGALLSAGRLEGDAIRCIPAASTAISPPAHSIILPAPPPSPPVARVTEVLGNYDDPGMEIEIALRKHNLPHEFSAEAQKLAEKMPKKVRKSDWKPENGVEQDRSGR